MFYIWLVIMIGQQFKWRSIIVQRLTCLNFLDRNPIMLKGDLFSYQKGKGFLKLEGIICLIITPIFTCNLARRKTLIHYWMRKSFTQLTKKIKNLIHYMSLFLLIMNIKQTTSLRCGRLINWTIWSSTHTCAKFSNRSIGNMMRHIPNCLIVFVSKEGENRMGSLHDRYKP